MAIKNALKNAFANFLGLNSSEAAKRPVKRVERLSDLDQTTTRETSFDPAAGRQVSSETPSALLTSSGHYLSNLDQSALGECVVCRAEATDAGEPDRVTLVVRGEGSGGICKGCGKCHCCDHGGSDDDGTFWCKECAFKQGIKKVEKAVVSALFGKREAQGKEGEAK